MHINGCSMMYFLYEQTTSKGEIVKTIPSFLFLLCKYYLLFYVYNAVCLGDVVYAWCRA